MITRTTYGKKLFAYFLMVFVVFTTLLVAIQYNRDKSFRARELESMLDTYCEFTNSFITKSGEGGGGVLSSLDSFVKGFPRTDIRITIIDFGGRVLFDSEYSNFTEMANHFDRPEIQDALLFNRGSDIRHSESVNRTFYYFAKKYDKYFIRTAVVYSTGIKVLLSGRSLFWLIVAFLFFAAASVIFFLSNNFGKAIANLKAFAQKAARNQIVDPSIKFPENELGFIGQQIVTVYKRLENTNKELVNEKEKLVRHLQLSQEGVAFFMKDGTEILSNNHFLNYLNIISDSPVNHAKEFWMVPEMLPTRLFLERQLKSSGNQNRSEKFTIEKNNRFFSVKCFIFQDNSYEVAIVDTTSSIHEKMLKHEMTSNIAHELRTPVSSIKGYLETILHDPNIPDDKKQSFIEKAASQAERLADLIRDIAMITQIEEASNLYKTEDLCVSLVINDAIESLNTQIRAVNATVSVSTSPETNIEGNRTLVFSVFRNLLENSLNYGGQDVTIFINEFLVNDDKVFYSFSDTGKGIDPIHQQRVFERFYRVDEGRARNEGGTGLGLAIVKHAVQFHGGEVSVKGRKGGGAEFLFFLKRKRNSG